MEIAPTIRTSQLQMDFSRCSKTSSKKIEVYKVSLYHSSELNHKTSVLREGKNNNIVLKSHRPIQQCPVPMFVTVGYLFFMTSALCRHYSRPDNTVVRKEDKIYTFMGVHFVWGNGR